MHSNRYGSYILILIIRHSYETFEKLQEKALLFPLVYILSQCLRLELKLWYALHLFDFSCRATFFYSKVPEIAKSLYLNKNGIFYEWLRRVLQYQDYQAFAMLNRYLNLFL